MKIAAAAYPLDFLENWEAYAAKQRRWVAEAASAGAELLVFPEYGAMELSALAGREAAGDMEQSMVETSRHAQAAAELHEALAREFGVYIIGGSGPVYDGGTRPVNRACVFGPDGAMGYQDKQIMTRCEREEMDVVPGGPLKLFEIGPFTVGITICYDSEFPLLARTLCEAGANLILAPSCTGALAGYWRVRVGAMARALENQCVTVHAPLIGDGNWCAGVGTATGAAGIFAPPDAGFPATGVIALGEIDKPGWVYGEVDAAAVAHVRKNGNVLNHLHWPEQSERLANVTCLEKT